MALLAVWMLLLSSTAMAQRPEGASEEPPEVRAAALAQRALAHYQAGRPEDAVPLLVEARRLYPEPLLLYNLARAYEALGREEEALDAYERYVAERPDADDRAAMEAHIAALRRQIAERRRLAAEREAERQRREAAEARAASGSGPWPWLVGSTGAAAIAAGVVLGVVAVSERDAAAAEPVHATTVARLQDAEAMATAANVLFVAGGTLLATGVVWLLVEALSAPSTERVTVTAGPGELGVSLVGAL